jgi:hypothetical protein
VFFISINCKFSEGSSRYETILEKLRGKEGSQGGRFFFLKKIKVTKWIRIQETKNMMNTIEAPLSFFPTTNSKVISRKITI